MHPSRVHEIHASASHAARENVGSRSSSLWSIQYKTHRQDQVFTLGSYNLDTSPQFTVLTNAAGLRARVSSQITHNYVQPPKPDMSLEDIVHQLEPVASSLF